MPASIFYTDRERTFLQCEKAVGNFRALNARVRVSEAGCPALRPRALLSRIVAAREIQWQPPSRAGYGAALFGALRQTPPRGRPSRCGSGVPRLPPRQIQSDHRARSPLIRNALPSGDTSSAPWLQCVLSVQG